MAVKIVPMIRYGKTTQTAIAAASRLAEVYSSSEQISSSEIAASRKLPRTLVAKLLTQLSQAGLVAGSRGPGGGYALSRPPSEITLADIAAVFERAEQNVLCPFGPEWCGTNAPCPLHDELVAFGERFSEWLGRTTLEVFADGRAQSG